VLPAASSDCIRTISDCLGREAGDYAYCDDCRKYATCAGSGFYVRDCPIISVFDPYIDKCVDYSANACKPRS